VLLFLVTLLFAAAADPADEPPLAAPPTQLPGEEQPPAVAAPPRFDLAHRLQDVGLSSQAYVEYLRQAALAPGDDEAFWLQMRALEVLIEAGAHDTALRHLEQLEPLPEVRMAASYTLFLEQQPGAALVEIARLDTPEASFLAGWCHLQLDDEEAAISSWRRVEGPGLLHDQALVAAHRVETWGPPPRRSPALAGVMSAVLPGAGQAYGGAWGDAGAAFLVNGLAIAGGVELARQEMWTAFALVALAEAGIWAGNVLGAVGGAHSFNRRARSRRIDRLLDDQGPVLVVGDRELGLTVQGLE